MSKYNPYAKRLEAAFKTARKEYKDAWQKMQAAQKAVDSAVAEEKRISAGHLTVNDAYAGRNYGDQPQG